MNLKYYDVLSSLVVGYVLLVIGMYAFEIEYNNDYIVAYLAMAFLYGYIINAIGSLLEPVYYFTIGGKPSNRLLSDDNEKHNLFYRLFIPNNTGIKKVRFYETKSVREILKRGMDCENPSEDRLFSKAMRAVNGDQNSRVPDFNAHYALSRTILTTVLISSILLIYSNPCCWQSYLSIARQATMTVWDVQLGLAVHVKAPNGKYIIIDLGTGTVESGNSSPLRKLMWNNIVYMIISHPHLDHISDILNFDINPPKILHRPKSLTNEEIMEGVRYCDRAKFEKYCEINDRYNSPVGVDDENYTGNPNNYDGLEIQTFSTSACDHSNFNNFSIITVFTLSDVKVVVCGDNEKDSLDILMQQRDFKDAVRNADVLCECFR